MRKRAVMAAACVLLVLASGCGKKEEAAARPPMVKYQRVSESTAESASSYAGTVRGRYETNLAFQVGGQILSRNVQLGDRVAAGQVLMTIDPKDVAQKANQGDAAVHSAEAQLKLAETNYARYQQLYAADAVSAMVLDQYRTSYEAALAAYNNAAAQAAQAQNALSYTQLTATGDGVISAVNAEAGQVVAAGTPVMSLVQTGELEIEINVPESKVAEFTAGKPCTVSFWALNGASAAGTVRETAPMADPVSRTYKVRVSVPNPPQGMALGMTANVSFEDGSAPAERSVLLPMSAIYQTGDSPQVWAVDAENRVHLKNVSVEKFDGNNVRVSGLSNDDIVVTAGVHRLQEGLLVRLGTEGDKP
ncbi:MAG: efflux RND transporter periplasmic adaptor subunit [Schwartzia sp.]|nr:efflux RND transporter periplasmic adaptor subunit [Schwartzia sp. (in: firmicutes)]